MIHPFLESEDALTIAIRLGYEPRESPLLAKLRACGLENPRQLVSAAVNRGCNHYSPYARGLAVDAPEISSEELAVALLSPERVHDPTLIRVASQLLSDPHTDVSLLVRLAREERCLPILRYIAVCGMRTEPANPFWERLLAELPETDDAPEWLCPHISRFRSETGVVDPRTPDAPKIIWLRPSR
ncbi:MAG: hypothetical protein QM680_07240 [Luteolibacter sp.]